MTSNFISIPALIVVALLSFQGIAQNGDPEKKSIFQTSLGFHKAKVLIHNKDLQVVKNSAPNGLQIDLAWQYRNEEAWNKCHCFPKIGMSIVGWDYDEKDILGYGISGLFFVEPEYNANGLISFSVKGAYGLSYMTRPYDEVSNILNQAYSTGLNFALYLGAKVGLRLSDRSKIHLGLFFNHTSNGGIKKPNRGLNYPSLELAFSRYTADPEFADYSKLPWDKSKRLIRLDISTYLSWKSMADNVHVVSPGIEVKGSRQFGKVNAMTLGLEYLYDNFLQYRLDQSGQTTPSDKFSAAIGHEFLLGKLIFSQQIGFYLYKPYKEGADMYQRYGLSYSFNSWLAFGVNMKTHGHVADLVDFRTIITLPKS